VDFSLFKNFNFGEGLSLQFRAEFFNIFNRANFGDPDEEPFDEDSAGFVPGVSEPLPRSAWDTDSDIVGLGAGDCSKAGLPICDIIPNPDAGRIDRTTTNNRQIQFGFKFLF